MLLRILTAYKDAYSGLPGQVWLLALITVANRMGTMVLPFLTLYITKELGRPVGDAGWAFAIFGVGAVAGSFFSGWLCGRMSPIWVQFWMLAPCGLCFWAIPYAPSFEILCGLLLMIGFFFDGFRPANATATMAICPAKMRARGFALSRLAVNVGMAIGPALGGILALSSYQLLFWVDGATSLLAAILLVTFFGGRKFQPKKEEEPASPPKASPWRDSAFLLVLVLTFPIALVFLQLHTAFPLYMKEYQYLNEAAIGSLFAVNTALIIVFEMLLTHRIEKSGWRPLRVIGWAAFFQALGFGLLPFGVGYLFVIFTVVIWTFGEMLAVPLASAWVSGRATAKNRGMYLGIFSSLFSFSSILAPPLGMLLYAHNAHTVWYVSVFFGLFSLAGFYLLDGRPRSQQADETGD